MKFLLIALIALINKVLASFIPSDFKYQSLEERQLSTNIRQACSDALCTNLNKVMVNPFELDVLSQDITFTDADAENNRRLMVALFYQTLANDAKHGGAYSNDEKVTKAKKLIEQWNSKGQKTSSRGQIAPRGTRRGRRRHRNRDSKKTLSKNSHSSS